MMYSCLGGSMRKPYSFLIALVLMLLPLASCHDANASIIKDLNVRISVNAMGTHYVVGYWTNAPITDGLGPLTANLTWNKVGTDSTGHTLSPTAKIDSFPIIANVGVQVAGTLCVKAQRRALSSTAVCKAWTFTEQDQPPPPPVIDSTVISQMVWPDSASLALMDFAFSDALPHGPLYWIRGPDTLYVNEWAYWGDALLLRPGPDCNAECKFNLTADTNKNSFAYSNWIEIKHQALAFTNSPKHRLWWDSTKACGGCAVYLPIDTTVPGAKWS